MFTGIIESVGEVVTVLKHDHILEMTVRSDISTEMDIDESVSHDGVCLTVVHASDEMHRVQLVKETCNRSTFGNVRIGDLVNLERAMPSDGRFEGHIVQGHVDCKGTFLSSDQGIFLFSYPVDYAKLVVEKGSVCINGVSLTIARLEDPDTFGVALIPYTLDHTNLGSLQPGTEVNLEFDILGKYIMRITNLQDK